MFFFLSFSSLRWLCHITTLISFKIRSVHFYFFKKCFSFFRFALLSARYLIIFFLLFIIIIAFFLFRFFRKNREREKKKPDRITFEPSFVYYTIRRGSNATGNNHKNFKYETVPSGFFLYVVILLRISRRRTGRKATSPSLSIVVI